MAELALLLAGVSLAFALLSLALRRLANRRQRADLRRRLPDLERSLYAMSELERARTVSTIEQAADSPARKAAAIQAFDQGAAQAISETMGTLRQAADPPPAR